MLGSGLVEHYTSVQDLKQLSALTIRVDKYKHATDKYQGRVGITLNDAIYRASCFRFFLKNNLININIFSHFLIFNLDIYLHKRLLIAWFRLAGKLTF